MSEGKKNLFTIPGVLVFELSGKQFCADVRDVYGFIDASGIKSNKNLSSPKKVYFDYFNNRIPFINFHKIFNLNPNQAKENSRLLFLEHNGIMICLLTDSIIEFIAFDDKITPQQEITNNKSCVPADSFYYEGKNFLLPHYSKIISAWKKSNHLQIKHKIRRSIVTGKNTLPP